MVDEGELYKVRLYQLELGVNPVNMKPVKVNSLQLDTAVVFNEPYTIKKEDEGIYKWHNRFTQI